jgi:hypothetical protein
VPSRNDPVNFAERADATLGALPSVIDGMNALGTYIERRGDEADVSAGRAAASENHAAASAQAAKASELQAAGSARAAASAPASPSTSTTDLLVGSGPHALVTQPGRLWAPGQYIRVSLTSDPDGVSMGGTVIDYDATTGLMNFVVGDGMAKGSGTFSGWTITSSGPPSTLAQLGLPGPASRARQIIAVNDEGIAYELRELEALFRPIRHLFGVPVGMVAYRAGSATPAGWLRLNGALLSRAAYPDLFAHAQAEGLVTEAQWQGGYFGRFSAGDGAANFRLPDARAMKLRGLDDGRGIDIGREWGRFQDSQNLAHNHAVYDPAHAHGVADGGHAHAAWTDAQGHHDHANGINALGGPYGLQQGSLAGTGNIAQIGMHGGYRTDGGGSHGHNVGIGVSGAGIGIYASGTGIGIYADGSAEARSKNIAYPLFIKY